MKILVIFFYLISISYANSQKVLKDYPDWLGFNKATLFCQCPQINGLVSQNSCGLLLEKNSEKLVPHHIYPIHKIAQKFTEYSIGHRKCFSSGKSFLGLACVRLVHEKFKELEEDLHNLTLIEPSLKKQIKDQTMGLVKDGKKIGLCPFKYDQNHLEFSSLYQGWIARVYLYLDNQYPDFSILTAEDKKHLDMINSLYKPTPQECRVTAHINKSQTKQNQISAKACQGIK